MHCLLRLAELLPRPHIAFLSSHGTAGRLVRAAVSALMLQVICQMLRT